MYENIFTVFLQFLQYHAPQKAVMLQRLGSPSQNNAKIMPPFLFPSCSWTSRSVRYSSSGC